MWRNETAKLEGVDSFRVLPNKALEEIARCAPRNKSEMIAIKGIKEAKFAKYGKAILDIVQKGDVDIRDLKENKDNLNYFRDVMKGSSLKSIETETEKQKTFGVGEFLDFLNEKMAETGSKIKGEVSSVDEREKVVYFSLKDKNDESVINCLIFRYQYEMLGVKLEEGAEVIVEGCPEIYKPYGKLSLKVNVIELEGEGALKKEYEKLKKKLDEEGFFDERTKKKFVGLPQKIGLITSREGAAIGDFTSNVGQFGLKIKFINSSVEGKRAVYELIDAIRTFEKMNIETLVIIRGGGSLESLQAFNNEALIREAKKIKIPIVCGVGHDKDVSLLSLASDYAVSTPTAAARLIGGLWEREVDKIDYFEKNIFEGFEEQIKDLDRKMKDFLFDTENNFQKIIRNIEDGFENFITSKLAIINTNITKKTGQIDRHGENVVRRFEGNIYHLKNIIEKAENIVKLNDPARQLKLGYGIVSKDGANVKSIENIQKDDIVKIRFWNGEAKSQIKEVKKIKE